MKIPSFGRSGFAAAISQLVIAHTLSNQLSFQDALCFSVRHNCGRLCVGSLQVDRDIAQFVETPSVHTNFVFRGVNDEILFNLADGIHFFYCLMNGVSVCNVVVLRE